MRFAVSAFPTDEMLPPDELARLAEERGFESLWFPEHSHIPASRETPYPMGGELPRAYMRAMDPLIALSAAAAVTTSLRLGTGVCLVTQRDPIQLAKEVASIDHLSSGRMLLGVGAGWNLEEMRNHGTDPKTRISLMRERVEAMQAIWTQDEASYHGRFVDFDRIWSWPKPVQRPYPPVLVGGNGPTVLDRVLAFGDGWLPNIVAGDDALLEEIGHLRKRAADIGRDVTVTVNIAPTEPERLARYVAADGVERGLFSLPTGDRDAVERRLDEITAAIATVDG